MVSSCMTDFFCPNYRTLVSEIHLLFDTPGSNMNFNSKLFEQNRRDSEKEGSSHNHVFFTPSTSTQISWRSHSDCRQCKASLVQALGVSFLLMITQQLRPCQSLYIVGAFLITLVIMFICFQEMPCHYRYMSTTLIPMRQICEDLKHRLLAY